MFLRVDMLIRANGPPFRLPNAMAFSGGDAAELVSRLYQSVRAAALSDCNGWFDGD
jgi:hypothetical protein